MNAGVRTIASRDNPDFNRWLRLARGRSRRGESEVLIEGEHLCRAWLDHRQAPDLLIVGESARELPPVEALWQRCAAVRRVVLHDSLARVLSGVEEGPAVFLVIRPPRPELPAHVEESCLCLDRVQDPGNVGTLLRTAAAAGVCLAFLSPGCARAWSPKALRSGQGAQFVLRIHEHVDLSGLADRLRIPLAATTLHGARPLFEADLRMPCAWIFGNEGQGVEPALLERATIRIRIPQEPSVESLNVAAAAAVCLFEQRRQQQGRVAGQEVPGEVPLGR